MVRRGQPERLGKIQKTILAYLRVRFDRGRDPSEVLECNKVKNIVARFLKRKPASLGPAFSTSIRNLEKKKLIYNVTNKELKKGEDGVWAWREVKDRPHLKHFRRFSLSPEGLTLVQRTRPLPWRGRIY